MPAVAEVSGGRGGVSGGQHEAIMKQQFSNFQDFQEME